MGNAPWGCDGMSEEEARYGVDVAGSNVSSSCLMVDLTLLGDCGTSYGEAVPGSATVSRSAGAWVPLAARGWKHCGSARVLPIHGTGRLMVLKVALAVNEVTRDPHLNLTGIVGLAREARRQGAALVLFPEAAPTGLLNVDDPARDLPLGQEIPGPVTTVLGGTARELGVYLAVGMLERAGDRLFDAALLFDPRGDIVLHYRRITPGWHGPRASPDVYGHGEGVGVALTALGSVAFLLCGDLFDDSLVASVRSLRPDWLLVPMARCFGDGSVDQARWDAEELPQYAERVALAGTTTLVVNYLAPPELEGGAFGGAWVFGRDGHVMASWPLGRVGCLIASLDPRFCGVSVPQQEGTPSAWKGDVGGGSRAASRP